VALCGYLSTNAVLFTPNQYTDKTRLLQYTPPRSDDDQRSTFDFLGFTHYWAHTRSGRWVIKRKTMAKRLARKLHEIWLWCKEHRHEPMEWQRERLASRLSGYYNYFGIPCNHESLNRVYRGVQESWRYWLNRRSQRAKMHWERFTTLAKLFPLPRPRIVHQWV
jgi:hypothetical protein